MPCSLALLRTLVHGVPQIGQLAPHIAVRAQEAVRSGAQARLTKIVMELARPLPRVVKAMLDVIGQ